MAVFEGISRFNEALDMQPDFQRALLRSQGVDPLNAERAVQPLIAARQSANIQAQVNAILEQSGGNPSKTDIMKMFQLDPTYAKMVLELNARPAASSTIGKIQADIDAGLIDPATGAAALKKATTIAPVYDPVTKQLIYAGGDGFTAPQGMGVVKGRVEIPPEYANNPAAAQVYLEEKSRMKAKEGSEENVIKKQKAELMRETALGLVNELLADPDAVKSITGTYDSKTPTVLPRSAEAESKIRRLRSILTAENLGLMTGVLSETDLKVIADIAGGGLDLNRADEGMIKELRTLQQKFGGTSIGTSSQSDPLGIR